MSCYFNIVVGNGWCSSGRPRIQNVIPGHGQYIGGWKVVTSRSALASFKLYCLDMAKNGTY